jgi:hypothetical protein
MRIRSEAIPWGTFAAVTIDAAVDGMLIGMAYVPHLPSAHYQHSVTQACGCPSATKVLHYDSVAQHHTALMDSLVTWQ